MLDSKNITKFNKNAQYYDKFSVLQDEIIQYFIKFIQQQKKCSFNYACELGCGTGNLTVLLANLFQNLNITGIDIAEKSINIARDKLKNYLNISLYNNNILDFQYLDYDCIFSSMCLHWLFDDLPKFLQNFNNKNLFFAIPIENSLFDVKNKIIQLDCINTIVNFPHKNDILDTLSIKYTIKYEIKTFTKITNCNYALKILKHTGIKITNNFNNIANIKKLLASNIEVDFTYEVLFIYCEYKS